MKKEFEHERRWGNKVLCVLFARVYGIMGVVGNIWVCWRSWIFLGNYFTRKLDSIKKNHVILNV